MLTLTKKTDYALIALSLLAKLPSGVVSARAIAEKCGVPVAILTNILKTLTHAGVVVSERGANGGYRLGRSPEAISLHEVITAIEGQVQFVRCLKTDDESDGNLCGLEPSCPVRMPAHRIYERLKQFLESTPLSELVETELEQAQVQQLDLAPVQRSKTTIVTTEQLS